MSFIQHEIDKLEAELNKPIITDFNQYNHLVTALWTLRWVLEPHIYPSPRAVIVEGLPRLIKPQKKRKTKMPITAGSTPKLLQGAKKKPKAKVTKPKQKKVKR